MALLSEDWGKGDRLRSKRGVQSLELLLNMQRNILGGRGRRIKGLWRLKYGLQDAVGDGKIQVGTMGCYIEVEVKIKTKILGAGRIFPFTQKEVTHSTVLHIVHMKGYILYQL